MAHRLNVMKAKLAKRRSEVRSLARTDVDHGPGTPGQHDASMMALVEPQNSERSRGASGEPASGPAQTIKARACDPCRLRRVRCDFSSDQTGCTRCVGKGIRCASLYSLATLTG